YQVARGLHQTEEALIDHFRRLRGDTGLKADEVGLPKEMLESCWLTSFVTDGGLAHIRVEHQEPNVEAAQTTTQLLPHGAKSDQPDCGAAYFDRHHWVVLSPSPLLDRTGCTCDVPSLSEHQANGEFRHRGGIPAVHVEHRDTGAGRGFNIDVLDARASHKHGLHRTPFQSRRRDRGKVH